MFGETSVKERLRRGEMQFGCFVNLASPISTYLAAGIGYDVVLLDHEHSHADFANAIACIDAASSSKAEVWARVPGNDQGYLKRILDSGADGVMCPMINTAEDAAALVRNCRYPPHGVRGVAPTITRHTGYGLRREEYMARVDRDLAIMPQIETAEAVENVERIVAVPGVDIVFVGPLDLSASLGHFGQTDHPKVVAAIERIERAVRAGGKILASLAVPGRDASVLLDRGYDLIFGGVDIAFLRTGMQEQLKKLQAARAAHGKERQRPQA